MTVAVITDSVASLPKVAIKRYSITIVPISIIINEKAYRDGIDITPKEVYEFLANGKNSATTSSPTPDQFIQAFKEVTNWADSIVCVTICSDISMMYDSATKAKEIFQQSYPSINIDIIDSRTAGGAQGFIALCAAKVASSGANLTQVTQSAKSMMPRVHMLGVLDTLHYLARAGRIPKIAAWGGSMFKINPILSFAQDEIGLLERARTKPKAINRMLEIMEDRVNHRPVHINLMHANVSVEAEDLKKQLEARFNCVELYTTDFSPTMGIQAGPGVIAVAFYCDESEEMNDVG